MIHDILLVALWAAGAFGCLFMIVAAALMLVADAAGAGRSDASRARP